MNFIILKKATIFLNLKITFWSHIESLNELLAEEDPVIDDEIRAIYYQKF